MFRDLPQYLNQQETSMPWCPSIPDHWHMSRNKALLEPKHEKVGLRSSDYDLLSLTKAGVIYRDIDGGKGKMPAAFDDYQAIEDGDLIMCLFDVDETPRTVGRARQRGMITGAYNRFVVEDEVLAEYLNLFYKSVDDVKGLRPLYRGLRKTVPIDSFLSSQVPLPPAEEQAAIVKYLAHANARIDNAIAAKRRLITLLEEQMRVLVERAISECTASTERLGFHIDLVTGFPFKSEDFRTTGGDGQRPLLRGINVGVGSLSSTDYVFVDEDIAQLAQSFELRAGDLVLGMDRPVIAKGVRLAEITSQLAGCLLVQRVARLRTKSTLEPSYLQTVFRSAAFTQYLEPIFTGISVPLLSP